MESDRVPGFGTAVNVAAVLAGSGVGVVLRAPAATVGGLLPALLVAPLLTQIVMVAR